jgi:hypothetical protein
VRQPDDLDALIERRARQAAEGRRTEESWRESVRAFHARRQGENCALWYSHHMSMSAVHTGLAQDHERRALELLEEETS